MSYDYQEMRKELLNSTNNIATLVKVTCKIEKLPETFTAEQAFVQGDAWIMLACLDYLTEQGFLRELEAVGGFAQHRRFLKICM